MKHIQRFHETESKVQAGLDYAEARKRSNNIQHIFLIIFCALAYVTGAWGQTPSYVLEADNEVRLGTNSAGEALKINGQGEKVRFQAKRGTAAGGGIHIQMSTDGGNTWGRDEYINSSLSGSYERTFEYNIDANVTHIRFKAQGTLYKYYRNVKVIRRTRLEGFSYTTSSPYDMNTLRYGTSTTTDIENVTYHVSTYPNTLTGTCEMSDGTETGTFSVEDVPVPSSEKGTGKLKIPITFSPKSPGAKSATVTLKFGETTVATFKVTGEGADKGTPAFIWNVTNAYKNHSYSDFFTSTNNVTSYTITSDKPTLGNYVDGKLVFYDGEGKVTFTVTQAGNDDWNAHTESFEVNVTEAQNHLPLEIKQENYNTLVRYISDGTCEWSNGGLTLKDNGLDDKIAEILFEGIPDKLTFDYTRNNGTAVGMDWRVFVSPDGNDWTQVFKETNNSGNCDFTFGDVIANCRYVRLYYSGNYGGTFKNVKITERKELKTENVPSLDFGTNTKGNAVTNKTFTLKHCNAGYGVTVTSSNSSIFTVSPTSLGDKTGGDLMGSETITVSYPNNTVGVYNNETITISDPNGTNAPITLTVSGTTQTTYYTRAVATTAGGGSAYITYDSGSASSTTTTSTSTENSGLVTTTNASKTVYLRAVPAAGYRFVEWRKDGIQVSTTATAQKSYDYNSETLGSPTVATYTAVFEVKTVTLNPASSTDPAGVYAGTVTLSRTLPEGYSTIALPFNTTVAQLTGRTNDGDWVAQLQTVTHTQADNGTANEYTLYFQKVDGGAITANQPYVLHLAEAKVTPSWTPSSGNTITVNSTASAGEKAATNGYSGYGGWVMHANYAVDFPMDGKYGIVNAQGGLMLGSGSDAKLKAFTAYITGPAPTTPKLAPRLRVAYVDPDGTTTVVEGFYPDTHDSQGEPVAIFGPDGQRRSRMQRGVNIVRYADGTTRKVQY